MMHNSAIINILMMKASLNSLLKFTFLKYYLHQMFEKTEDMLLFCF